MNKYTVLPIKKIVSDKGTVWESYLFNKGWNNLPPSEKIGEITGAFKLPSGQIVFDVFWPAINLETKNIFPDEICKVSL